jgi:sterol desaturase/sphingolipid hydroxylase (fatty acid hydroxylase superfamily)
MEMEMDWWWLARLLNDGEQVSADPYGLMLKPALELGVWFTGTTALLTALDLWNPGFWQRLEIVYSPKLVRPRVTWKRLGKMAPTLIRNVLWSAFAIYVAWNLRVAWSPHLAPSASQAIFWTAHYVVHQSPTLFRWIHSQHHKHYEVFAATAIDCSVAEMLLLNLTAVIIPALILIPDNLTHRVWMALAAVHVPCTHSGHLLFSGRLADEYHYLHHRHPNCNFGSAFLDSIAGTYRRPSGPPTNY